MRTTTKTYDEMALDLILRGEKIGSPAFKKLAQEARDHIEPHQSACPHCGHRGPHQDNGESATSVFLTLLCEECDTQWDPNDGGH